METDLRQVLCRHLQNARDAVLAAVDGLSEYDARRPLTPTGTNLLGLVKHLAGLELGYLVECVGRENPVPLPWVADGSIWDGADMWATATESRDELVALYRTAWRHADDAIAALGLDAPATVPWWPRERQTTTLGALLVRMVTETAQHAGHAEIVRELVDGATAIGEEENAATEWTAHYERVLAAAEAHR